MTRPATAREFRAPMDSHEDTLFEPDTEQLLREHGIDRTQFAAMMDFVTQANEALEDDDFITDRDSQTGNAGEDGEALQLHWNPKLEELVGSFGIEPHRAREFFDALARNATRERRRNPPFRHSEIIDFSIIPDWPEPVTGAAILPELADAIRGHAGCPEPQALTAALWVMHTHVLQAFEVTPRLVISSPEPGGEKPRLLRVLSHLAPRPLAICAGSPRALLDSLGYSPTLLISDGTMLLRSSEMAAILRNGWQRNNYLGLNLLRQIEAMHLFTAAALTVEGRPPAALRGRCIEIRTGGLSNGEPCGTTAEAAPGLEELRHKCARWAADQLEALREAEAGRPDGNDNWGPLLAVAKNAGPDWEARAREAMHSLAGVATSPLHLLLSDIHELLQQVAAGQIVLSAPDGMPLSDRDRIRSCDLARLLAGLKGKPWSQWGKTGQPISTGALARLLAEAGVRPAHLHFRTVTATGAASYFDDRGYLVGRFAEAFASVSPDRAF